MGSSEDKGVKKKPDMVDKAIKELTKDYPISYDNKEDLSKDAKKLNRLVIYYAIVLPIITIILLVIIIVSTMNMVNKLILDAVISGAVVTVLAENEDADVLLDELGNSSIDYGESWGGDLIPGIYPSDPDLRKKAQILELARDVAPLVGMKPEMIFAIAYVESGLNFTYSSNTPDIYTQLVTSAGKDSWFTGGDIRHGKVQYQGHDKAIGPFQFETEYIDGEMTHVFTPSVHGGPLEQAVRSHMEIKDSSLDISRPHPLFLPDAMFNAGKIFEKHMNTYRPTAQADSRFGSLPQEIQDQIVYIYACDRYRGTIGTSSKNGIPMHKAMVSFYIDVYQTYGGLTEFYDGSKENTRAICMGTNIGGSSGSNWDGVLQSPVSVNGRNHSESLLKEMTDKTSTGLNYMNLFNQVKSGGSMMFRFGVGYGFEALNGGFSIYNDWDKEVRDALTAEGLLNNPGGSGTGSGGDPGDPQTPGAGQTGGVIPPGIDNNNVVGGLNPPIYNDANFRALMVEAEKCIQKPYGWGAQGPNSFDCSGMIYWIYKETGVSNIGRTTTREMYRSYIRLKNTEVSPGDLVFYNNGGTSIESISHVGMYIGNGKIIHHFGPNGKKGAVTAIERGGTKIFGYARVPTR